MIPERIIFVSRGIIKHKRRVFITCKLLSETSHSKTNSWTCYHQFTQVLMNSAHYSREIKKNLNFSGKTFRKILECVVSLRFVHWEPCCSKMKDRRTDMTKPIQSNLGSRTLRITNNSVYEQISPTQSVSDDVLCHELRTRKPSTSWSDKLGVSASAVFVGE